MASPARHLQGCMHFDIVFLDTTANKYYDRQTLEKEPLGGTEASVVRVAEGLGALGLKVAVMETRVEYFEPIMGQHCFFIHGDEAPNTTCRHFIQIRENKHPHLFPGSKKYIWLHDVADSVVEGSWLPSLVEHKIQVITVSRWHRNNLREVLPGYDRIAYIYNPVEESLYKPSSVKLPYNSNVLTWTASPHKGLAHALQLFREIRKSNPKMQFVIFNPGYHQLKPELSLEPGVMVPGPTNCRTLWAQVEASLCIFYPVQWKETFGCIAAEANAMGVPIATFRKAALKEVVSSDNQMVADHDDEGIVKMVLEWSKNGRPEVSGREEFKYGEVILKWVKLLAQ